MIPADLDFADVWCAAFDNRPTGTPDQLGTREVARYLARWIAENPAVLDQFAADHPGSVRSVPSLRKVA